MKSDSPHGGARVLLLSTLAASTILFALACGTKQAETYKKAETRTDEAAAIRALQTIYSAEIQYSTTHSGTFGTLDQLVTDGYLDKRFSGTNPVVEGYVFNISVVGDQDSSPGSSFQATADPKDASAQSARHLYLNASSNVIHVNATRPATALDPPLQ